MDSHYSEDSRGLDKLYGTWYGLDSRYSDFAVGLSYSTATVIGWTVILTKMLWAGQSVEHHLLARKSLQRCCCGLDSQYNNSCGLDSHYSDVAGGSTVSTASVMGWTVIMAMLLWAGQSLEQMLLDGQSL